MSGPEQDAVMTVREVSQYLKLAKSTVYKLVQEGVLPGRKVGGTWRFSRKQLDSWLEQEEHYRISDSFQEEAT